MCALPQAADALPMGRDLLRWRRLDVQAMSMTEPHNDRCASLLGQGCDCRSPFPDDGLDGLPPYVPVERIDTFVRCQRCGATVEGDVVGQQQHDIWHRSLADQIEHAGRHKFPPRYGSR